jgi:hypothetical protein
MADPCAGERLGLYRAERAAADYHDSRRGEAQLAISAYPVKQYLPRVSIFRLHA